MEGSVSQRNEKCLFISLYPLIFPEIQPLLNKGICSVVLAADNPRADGAKLFYLETKVRSISAAAITHRVQFWRRSPVPLVTSALANLSGAFYFNAVATAEL